MGSYARSCLAGNSVSDSLGKEHVPVSATKIHPVMLLWVWLCLLGMSQFPSGSGSPSGVWHLSFNEALQHLVTTGTSHLSPSLPPILQRGPHTAAAASQLLPQLPTYQLFRR